MLNAANFLLLLAIYLGCGAVFAIPFGLWGGRKIDPHAVHGSWGFRLIILPGVMAFWPLLLQRWLRATRPSPPSPTPKEEA